jgi:hypothetical protein
VDRLSILPPNLIGVIYDNLDSDADHHFRPIVHSLLHSQLNNLYRRVEFTSKLRFAKFCRTLSGINGNKLGRMVKAMLLDSLSIEGGAGDDEAGIGSAQREREAMVIEGQVQLMLPKSLDFASSKFTERRLHLDLSFLFSLRPRLHQAPQRSLRSDLN